MTWPAMSRSSRSSSASWTDWRVHTNGLGHREGCRALDDLQEETQLRRGVVVAGMKPGTRGVGSGKGGVVHDVPATQGQDSPGSRRVDCGEPDVVQVVGVTMGDQ